MWSYMRLVVCGDAFELYIELTLSYASHEIFYELEIHKCECCEQFAVIDCLHAFTYKMIH